MRKFSNQPIGAEDITRTCNALHQLADMLASFGVRFAYVFGSYGRHLRGGPQPGPLSDVDIAVSLGESVPDDQVDATLGRLGRMLTVALKRDDIDLIHLDTVHSPVLRRAIMTQGYCVYSSDERARLESLCDAVDQYMDTRHLRAVQDAYLIRRIRGGRFGR